MLIQIEQFRLLVTRHRRGLSTNTTTNKGAPRHRGGQRAMP